MERFKRAFESLNAGVSLIAGEGGILSFGIVELSFEVTVDTSELSRPEPFMIGLDDWSSELPRGTILSLLLRDLLVGLLSRDLLVGSLSRDLLVGSLSLLLLARSLLLLNGRGLVGNSLVVLMVGALEEVWVEGMERVGLRCRCRPCGEVRKRWLAELSATEKIKKGSSIQNLSVRQAHVPQTNKIN